MRNVLLTSAVLLTICVSAVAQESPIAKGANPEVPNTYKFTEGPASDSEGNIYFTDQPNNRILKWSPKDGITEFLRPAGRSNGLCFDSKGRLWACADEENELWMIRPDGSHEVVVDGYKGKLLNGPNDLWITPDGGIYFTDPFYKRPYWDRGPMEQDVQGVYYLSPDREDLVRVIDDLKQPNGIIGTPDGEMLYVTDIKAGRTYAYDIRDDASLTNKRLFCKMGSDGMTIDNEGNVYLTNDGVFVFNPEGEQIEHIEIPQRWTANVCFGGPEGHLLFITACKQVYTVRMRTRGVGSQ